MNDDELREMIRQSIGRHLQRPSLAPPEGGRAAGSLDASHRQFAVLQRADSEGACLIEPSVRCNHCGYCLSYGH